MVTDIVTSSWAVSGLSGAEPQGPPSMSMSLVVRQTMNALREFMFRNVYEPEEKGEEGQAARRIVRLLYEHFNENRTEIPPEYGPRSRSEDDAVVDYISGMTDQYAIRVAEKIRPGIAKVFRSRLV
jgi:dGTPase